MSRNSLEQILSLGESQQYEFKTTINIEDLGRHVCAFLNSGGGYVICGVDERGTIVGLPGNVDIPKIELQLMQNLTPKALVTLEMQGVVGKQVLVIEVPAGKDIPYGFRNQVFVRDTDHTVMAAIETLREMIMRRQAEPERWERRFSSAELDEVLDVTEVSSLVLAAAKSLRFQFRNSDNPIMVLEDLSVVKYGQLTNGGDVLFTKNPARRHPQIRVQAASFTQDKADDSYRDMKSFEGPLVPLLENLYTFIQRNTPTRALFRTDSLEREDKSLYPPEAIREGLINAFAHRDYTNFSGGVSVHIYPDRLEISNSGKFPEGVTPEKLMVGQISVLRNPDIAHVLYIRGLMEKLGRGSVLIQRSCTEYGLPLPRWSEDDLGVTLTFFAPEQASEVTGDERGDETGQVAGKVTGTVAGEVAGEVTGEVVSLLMTLTTTMTRTEIQETLKLKGQANFRERYLEPAMRQGLIEMTRPDKPNSRLQKYRLTDKGRAWLAGRKA